MQWLQGLYRPDRYQYEMRLSGAHSVEAQIFVGTSLADPFPHATRRQNHEHPNLATRHKD
jgi:hypothetical protein